VAGSSYSIAGNRYAFLWRAATLMRALSSLGGTDSSASGINARGQMAGYSYTGAGEIHACVWP